MNFKRSTVRLNDDVTLNKGDIKIINELLLTTRCIHTTNSVDKQIEIMMNCESDVKIIADRFIGEDREFPFRYITIARKSTNKELATLNIEYTTDK